MDVMRLLEMKSWMNNSYRVAIQLDPGDNILIVAITYQFAQKMEDKRISILEKVLGRISEVLQKKKVRNIHCVKYEDRKLIITLDQHGKANKLR